MVLNLTGKNGGELGDGWMEVKTFVSHVLASKLFMVFATLLIMSVNGSGYMFGLYSNDIKSSLGYDQTSLNFLSFFKDLGGNLGILAGLVYEVAPPWLVLSIGSMMNFSGFFTIWLAVTNRMAKPHLWQMCSYMSIGANSQSFPNTGALVTCVKNSPQSRGNVLGLLKGFIGLSGAIMIQFYHAFYGDDDSKSLILFIACLPTIVPLVFLRTVRVLKVAQQRKEELKIFYSFLFISLGLAGFIMVVIILQNNLSFTRIGYVGSASVVLILLFLPLATVVKKEFIFWTTGQGSSNHSQVQVVTENPTTVAATAPATREPFACFKKIFKLPERGEDYTILQAISSVDMLVLLIATTCGIGGTLTVIDNLGQIGKSLGYPTHSLSTFISLVSVWNFLGRVVAGYASELVLAKYKFPRPLMLTFVILLSSVSQLLIAFAVPNSLYFASMMTGFCLGAQLPLVCAIISELFGLKHYSTMYNIGSISSPVGSFIFNVRVAGHLYDKEALKQMAASGRARKAGQHLTCNGVQCYRLAFLIISAASLFGGLVSLILVFRTRTFYKGDIYKKFREELMEPETDIGSCGNAGVPSRETEGKRNVAITDS